MGGVSGVSAVTLLLLLACVFYGHLVDGKQFGPGFQQLRKLLQVDAGGASSSSHVLASDHCSMEDIVVSQDATPPLPSGIPTYTVTVLNLCRLSDGCAMGQIHLSCGAFSSVLLVNPRIFRRLSVGDCLLNDGLPFPSGSSISFQYANSFSYPLAITNATCVPSS